MKKSLRRFTLVEMLTVVAIIGILAGLIIPTVALSQQRGRITQAKSDITSLMTALKGLDSDYNKMAAGSGTTYKLGNATLLSTDDSNVYASNNLEKNKEYSTPPTKAESAVYDAIITELSAPKNTGLTTPSVNKRKRVYLDAKSGFDPETAYNDSEKQRGTLWRDPWGNPYKIMINVKKTGSMELPGASTKHISADVAIYSFGSNGQNNEGCDVDLDDCISSGTHKNHDDVASWRL